MIVHLGLGAFHRAHQAVYTQDAGGWEICGVAHRRRTVADALRANGWRYTVISRGPEPTRRARSTSSATRWWRRTSPTRWSSGSPKPTS